MFFYDNKTLNKVTKVILWIFFICVFIVGCSEVSDKMHKTLHPQQAKQESIKAKKEKQKANKTLRADLDSDTQASQTNDNQSDPAAALNYTNYVNSVKYDGNYDITVHVNNNFLALNEQQRISVINNTQAMAKSSLLRSKTVDESEARENPFTTIRLGQEPLGNSKISDPSSFKWYK